MSKARLGKPNYKTRGDKSHFWKGGVSKRNHRLRNKIMATLEYKNWRRAVLKRDGYKCIICETTEKVQVDHIKPFAKYPKLRFEVSNGRVLCFDCHRKTPTYSRK